MPTLFCSFLNALFSGMQTAASSAAVAESYQKSGKAMNAVSQSVNPAAVQQDMKNFAYRSEQQQAMQSFMDDVLDSALDPEGIGEDTNIVVQQLLDEVGIEFASKMANVPAVAPPQPQRNAETVAADAKAEDRLAQQLAALRAL